MTEPTQIDPIPPPLLKKDPLNKSVCPLTLDSIPIDDCATLECRHSFTRSVLVRFFQFKISENERLCTCPVCRRSVASQDLLSLGLECIQDVQDENPLIVISNMQIDFYKHKIEFINQMLQNCLFDHEQEINRPEWNKTVERVTYELVQEKYNQACALYIAQHARTRKRTSSTIVGICFTLLYYNVIYYYIVMFIHRKDIDWIPPFDSFSFMFGYAFELVIAIASLIFLHNRNTRWVKSLVFVYHGILFFLNVILLALFTWKSFSQIVLVMIRLFLAFGFMSGAVVIIRNPNVQSEQNGIIFN